MIVVDASLAAKWVLAEPDSRRATEFLLKCGHDLIAPDLILIEVASGIVRRANANKALIGEAAAGVDQWTRRIVPTALVVYPTTAARVSAAAGLALRLGHPVADCVYLGLAIEFDCELATCDVRFIPKARTIWPHVRLLADYAAA